MKQFSKILKAVLLNTALIMLGEVLAMLLLMLLNLFLPDNDLVISVTLLMPVAIFIIYGIFSNTRYKSISAIILKYRLIVEKGKEWRIILSNVAILFFTFIYIFLYAEESRGWVFYVSQVILFIEVFSCLYPKIGTRMSFYLLKIDWVEDKKIPKKKKKPIDKIMI